MKVNLAEKFLVPLGVLIFLLVLFLSYSVTSILRTSMLNRAATFVADFVQLQAKNHISDPLVFSSPSAESQAVFTKVQSEVKTKEVIRIKVWNSQKMVIYSDDANIVGKIFNDNDELTDALQGKIKTDIVSPSKEENIDEKNYKQLMEIYVPIFLTSNTTPDGIIETYYTLDNLNAEILQVQSKVIGFIIFIFFFLAVVVWLLVHFLIIHPLRIFERATKEIEKGNFDSKVIITSHDELGSLATSFNNMSDGLKRLQELRNEFVYIGAHELKTPVTAINGFISLLFETEDSKNLSGETKEYLESIRSVTKSLNQLVGNILEIARNDAGKIVINVKPVDIESLITEIINETKPLSDKRKITVSYSQPSRKLNVLADEGKLKEVVMNLISNAIKYGAEGGYVNITHELTDNTIITHISNNGVGIPKDQQQQIFSQFFRAQNVTNADYEGTGLGLFITKTLIEKMKGNIWFISEENKETTFCISMPIAKESKEAESPEGKL